MTPGTLVLLGSPLLAAHSWGALPDALSAGSGREVVDVPVSDDVEPPFGQRYVTSVVGTLRTAATNDRLVLIAHSAAGPLLPGVGRALRNVGHRIGGYVFLDARLPGAGLVNRLDILRLDDAARADFLRAELDAGQLFPDWSVPGVETRPRGKAFYEEILPTSDDWPDAPCGYLRCSAAYSHATRTARARGWPVIERLTDDHIPWLDDATSMSDDVLRLIEMM